MRRSRGTQACGHPSRALRRAAAQAVVVPWPLVVARHFNEKAADGTRWKSTMLVFVARGVGADSRLPLKAVLIEPCSQ